MATTQTIWNMPKDEWVKYSGGDVTQVDRLAPVAPVNPSPDGADLTAPDFFSINRMFG